MARGVKSPGKPAWEDIQFSSSERKYTEAEFSVPSHDAHGHSVREWVRFMPQMAGELELLVASLGKLCGYQTKADIVRHAVARHIAWLHQLEPTVPRTYLGALQAQTILLQEDRHKCQTEAVFKDLIERVEHHLQAGDHGEAVRQMSMVKAALDNTPDTPWKRRWLSRFRRQYGVWLNPVSAQIVDAPKQLSASAPVAVPNTAPRPAPPDDDGEMEPEDQD